MDENLRVGYETSIQLMIYEGGLVWSRFNTMLTTHLVLFGIIGLILTSNNEIHVYANCVLLTLAIIGMILSFLWFIMTSRGFAYLQYVTLTAREYEDKFASEDLKTLKRGYDFIRDEEVTFKLPEPLNKYQRPWYARSIRLIKNHRVNTEKSAYGTIIAIAALYVLLFVGSFFDFFTSLSFNNKPSYSEKNIQQNGILKRNENKYR